MLSDLKAVLLDMDGTLFDSEVVYKSLWQKTAYDFGIDLNDKVYQSFVGAHFDTCKQLIQELGDENFVLNDFLAAMDRQDDAQRVPLLKPGAADLLQWLQTQMIPVALVTSAAQEEVEKNFAGLGGTSAFKVIVCGDDVENRKPHPEPYQLACKRLGISPEQALAVEDSNTGTLSAITAGCQTVVVPDILPITAEIERHLVAKLDSLVQLPGLLMNVHKQL